MTMRLPYKTPSLCPECLKRVTAEVFEENGKVMVKKVCKEHGEFKDVYWGDVEMFKKAARFAHDGPGISTPHVDGSDCPFSCGLCNKHKSQTALLNIVLTNRCDLKCWYCFFYAQARGYVYEPSIEQIREMVRNARDTKPIGTNAVQLTGGEPTLREDLIDIVKVIREEGIEHIQLNTNGIRMAREPDLALRLREAGVNTVYLSFDGVDESAHPKNFREVSQILDNCRKADLGVVFVPTILKTINDHQLGDIIEYASQNIDIVRGVNFQPVSLVGRLSRREREKYRITIPGAIKRIEEQTGGELAKSDFYPVPSVAPISHFVEAQTALPQYELTTHFACGMATYAFKEESGLLPITRFLNVEGLFEHLEEKSEAINNSRVKRFRALKDILDLRRFVYSDKAPSEFDISKILFDVLVRHDYTTLGKFHMRSLFIGMMHFQDLYNYDLERVKRCEIHYATPDGRIIPFCAFNVIPEIYRDKIQAEYGVPIKEWEKKNGKKLQDELYRVIGKEGTKTLT